MTGGHTPESGAALMLARVAWRAAKRDEQPSWDELPKRERARITSAALVAARTAAAELAEEHARVFAPVRRSMVRTVTPPADEEPDRVSPGSGTFGPRKPVADPFDAA